jgi:putative protease
MKKPELLAPAGDLERLKIALDYGADAVYVGGLFNLRANTPNFTIEELKEGVNYAHKNNKKVYVTVNIVMHGKELNKLEKYLKELKKINVDAIIVSDPAVIKYDGDKTSTASPRVKKRRIQNRSVISMENNDQ